jgi:hypothetical protein
MPDSTAKRRRQNEWYMHTYNTILDMADWSDVTSEIEKKIVCVFSWMPQGIMNVKDKGEMLKAELYSPADLAASLNDLGNEFQAICGRELQSTAIEDVRTHIQAIWTPLYKVLGASAASKYLHFSIPRLLPMSDRSIRRHYCGDPRIDDYLYYMVLFQKDLKNDVRQQKAREACADNLVRGLDIVNMRGDLPSKASLRGGERGAI